MTSKQIVLVLRFRDLARPEAGYTIREHSKIVATHGYVWWAWWKKQSERIPYELWNDLARQIGQGGPAKAFLLDSGQRKLYETSIAALELRLGEDLTPSPEGGQKTPEYYNKESFATWFKLGEMREVAPNELGAFAYLQAPHDDLVSFDRKAFENRKIAGVEQLLEFGNVTYWVATPASSDSLEPHDVPVRTRIPPAISGSDVLRAGQARILHISDLHVAKEYHAFTVGNGDRHNLSMAAAIFQSLGSDRIPGIVVVSGDLTWTGAREEFDSAFESLDALRSTLGLNRQDFVIVPGNHDVQWTKPQVESKKYKWDGSVEVASSVARKNYEDFFRHWYGTQPNSVLSIGRRFFLVGGPTVDVLGLNSCELQQVEGGFSGLGRITTSAFQFSATEFGWADKTRATKVRILVTHHHVLPVNPLERPKDFKKGFGVALDAEGQLLLASENGVDLILHGHQHQPYAGYTVRQTVVGEPINDSRGILIVGSGSTGVVDEHLGPIQQRCFNLLELREGGVELEVFGTPKTRTEFASIARLEARYGEAWKRVK